MPLTGLRAPLWRVHSEYLILNQVGIPRCRVVKFHYGCCDSGRESVGKVNKKGEKVIELNLPHSRDDAHEQGVLAI